MHQHRVLIEFLLLNLAASGVIVAVVIARAYNRIVKWAVSSMAILAVASVILNCMLPLVVVQLWATLLVLFVTAVCLPRKPKPWVSVLATVAVMLGCYSWGFWISTSSALEHARLRREFPFESVAQRLEHEDRWQGRNSAVARESKVMLSPDVAGRLAMSEEFDGSMRANMLRELHDSSRDQFLEARGFGVVRMGMVQRRFVELPVPEPVRSVCPLNETSDGQVAPSPDEWRYIHDNGLRDLFDPSRIGYVQDRDHVAGFQAHQFTRLPSPESSSWVVVRLELVSLLNETPRVYVTETLPVMDQLADVPTRTLDAFEKSALVRLKTEEDVVTDDSGSRIRMLGSLRAGNDCLKCHTVQRGELLGALSYELAPGRAKPE